MKNLTLIVWLTQLGMSVAIPLAGFILLAVWLNQQCGWGNWVIWVGVFLGVLCAVQGFRNSLKAMERLAKDEKKLPVGFGEHD